MILHQLRHFLILADTGSVSRAASLLGVSRPTITRSLNELEETFGLSLMNRFGGNYTLTTDGEYCYQMAQELIGKMDILYEQMDMLKTRLSSKNDRTVRISLSPAAASTVYPSLMLKLKEQQPDIQLIPMEYGLLQARKALADGTIDFHLSADTVVGNYIGNYSSINVMQPKSVCCVSKDHPLAKLSSVTFDELANYPFAAFSRFIDEPSFFSRHDVLLKKRSKVIYRTQQMAGLRAFVASGAAYTVLLQGMISDSRIAEIPIDPLSNTIITLIWNNNIYKNSACYEIIRIANEISTENSKEEAE